MPIQILQPFNPLWQVGVGWKGSSYGGDEPFELYPVAVLKVDGCNISHQIQVVVDVENGLCK